jgi:hypothetical protein
MWCFNTKGVEMQRRIFRSHKEPIRGGLSWDQRWRGPDNGLICCWETGRELRERQPELGKRAETGELPVLAWKGGVENAIKTKKKHGSLCYLAQWQGLRGEDLDIDMSQDTELVCSRTGQRVIYTGDAEKYSEA